VFIAFTVVYQYCYYYVYRIVLVFITLRSSLWPKCAHSKVHIFCTIKYPCTVLHCSFLVQVWLAPSAWIWHSILHAVCPHMHAVCHALNSHVNKYISVSVVFMHKMHMRLAQWKLYGSEYWNTKTCQAG